ncbi:MAG: sterol desaturase family protein [Bacteriovoracia bacterium]
MERYRKAFREKVIPRYYSGALHVLLFALIQLVAIVFMGLKVSWSLKALGIVFLTLVYATTFTYFLHRFLLHRPVPGFRWAHKMHHWHHTFYKSSHMEYDSLNDVYMLLMPPWIQIFYYVVYLPALTFIVGMVFHDEVVFPFIFGLTFWYGLYELIHWIEHLPPDHVTMKIPFMRALRKHHVGHHSKLSDKVNFGIVEPSWDYILGTRR